MKMCVFFTFFENIFCYADTLHTFELSLHQKTKLLTLNTSEL